MQLNQPCTRLAPAPHGRSCNVRDHPLVDSRAKKFNDLPTYSSEQSSATCTGLRNNRAANSALSALSPLPSPVKNNCCCWSLVMISRIPPTSARAGECTYARDGVPLRNMQIYVCGCTQHTYFYKYYFVHDLLELISHDITINHKNHGKLILYSLIFASSFVIDRFLELATKHGYTKGTYRVANTVIFTLHLWIVNDYSLG